MKRLIPVLLVLALLCGCGTCKHSRKRSETCTEGIVCADCGETVKSPAGHTASEGTCDQKIVCTVCHEVLQQPKEHTPGPVASCAEGQVCTVCHAVLSEPAEHIPSGEASCTEDVICTVCGTMIQAAAHLPGEEPTCINNQLCQRCGMMLQPAFGHSASGNVCGICGVTMSLDASSPEGSYIHETVSGVHYHNTLDAYYSGAVLVCGDYALEHFTMSRSGSAAWADAVNGFAARFPELQVSAMIVPKSCAYHSPAGFENGEENQQAFISATYDMLNDGIIGVDAMGLMTAHSGEYLFYRTDHHWTSLGAYYASVAYCEALGIVPRQLGSYETVVQTGYVGSLYSFCTSPQPCLKENPDYTVYHLPEADHTMTIGRGGAAYEAPLLYTGTSLYASGFIYGDNPLSIIETDNETGRCLLVFKESYGNAFVPYMADYFDTVVVVDIRSFDGSLRELVDAYGITDALIINNIQASTSLTNTLANTLSK